MFITVDVSIWNEIIRQFSPERDDESLNAVQDELLALTSHEGTKLFIIINNVTLTSAYCLMYQHKHTHTSKTE